MSLATTFGSGGAEPYARALRGHTGALLYLHEFRPGARRRGARPAAIEMNVDRWNADADLVDRTLLASVRGPVLDVGCGPARMVRAAAELGLGVLGIDVSPAAIEIGRAAQLPVALCSVFDAEVPGAGTWQTVLLVDGNIGIGGDVTALLARCAELAVADGEIVVEVHADPRRDRTFLGQLADAHGERSASFPWAEIGAEGLLRRAAGLGLVARQCWSADGRTFCRLAKSRA
ncbi:class I SAM-dependent methyltransferase [Galbitalea soli]|uniref:Methyltransferase domain-containing protein n=1 Tax=Galbitalea soli TaxID=1268042 RepID=A0A7C9TPH4_9MICO|nr:class I SAM-dependent methyltransferase [Galbitalea soli]NEM90757.1 methyltransferase domain-containing protein [Galbitalea soli]NYJ31475.1 SAM-dependent methyltransferase [Galbitalea soli]